jgi:hypothetical protein
LGEKDGSAVQLGRGVVQAEQKGKLNNRLRACHAVFRSLFIAAVLLSLSALTAQAEGFSSITVGAHVQFRNYGVARLLNRYFPVETQGGIAEGYEIRQIDEERVVIVQ